MHLEGAVGGEKAILNKNPLGFKKRGHDYKQIEKNSEDQFKRNQNWNNT
jgi:hypothetical protein